MLRIAGPSLSPGGRGVGVSLSLQGRGAGAKRQGEGKSVTLEFRGAFGREGFEGSAEVVRRHADRLGLGLHLDRGLEADVPFLVELGLGDAMGEGRAAG